MADVVQALYYQLANTAGVTALVSTRIYPIVMPQNPTLPAITYQMISNVEEEVHRGMTGDARPRFQITCWAATELAAAAVATQVRLAVMAMSGTIAAVPIKGTWVAGETRGYEPDTFRYFSARDFFIAHTEAV